MDFDLRRLGSLLERAGDVPPEQAVDLVMQFFGDAKGASLRSTIARSIFAEMASEYVLVKRTKVTVEGMHLKNTISARSGSSLRSRQRFIIEPGKTQKSSDLDADGQSRVGLDLPALAPGSSHLDVVRGSHLVGDTPSRTSTAMRRFTKLARGGHLVARGGVSNFADGDHYSTVYDTIPSRSWGPKGWFAGGDPSRSRSRGLPDSSQRNADVSESHAQQRPMSTFSEYVRERQGLT